MNITEAINNKLSLFNLNGNFACKAEKKPARPLLSLIKIKLMDLLATIKTDQTLASILVLTNRVSTIQENLIWINRQINGYASKNLPLLGDGKGRETFLDASKSSLTQQGTIIK